MNAKTNAFLLFALAASGAVAGLAGGYLIDTWPNRGARIEAETMAGHLYIAGTGADCRAAWAAAAAKTEPGTRRVICIQGATK